MNTTFSAKAWATVVLTGAASCTLLTQFDPEGQPCDKSAPPALQCLTDAGYFCNAAGLCTRLGSGVDAGRDAGTDAGRSAGGADGGHDAGALDSGTDAGLDGGSTDSGSTDGGSTDGGDAGSDGG